MKTRFVISIFRLFVISWLLAPFAYPQTTAPQQPEKAPAPRVEKRQRGTVRIEGRDREQTAQKLVAALALKPGENVADVGTGTGYMLHQLSRAVSPGGIVYAEDIAANSLELAKKNAAQLKLDNVRFILGDDKNARLPAREIDAVLILDAYHHFDYPKEMLESIRSALKPDGRIAIVDFFKRGAMANHVDLDRDDVVKQVEGFGWELESSPELLTNQFVLIFRLAPSASLTGESRNHLNLPLCPMFNDPAPPNSILGRLS